MVTYDRPTSSDQRRIEEALALAAEDGSTAYPGPMDACLIVSRSGMVSYATAQAAAEGHCHRALRLAGDGAIGATAYFVQEPSTRLETSSAEGISSVKALLDA